jgi:hypothetical protein
MMRALRLFACAALWVSVDAAATFQHKLATGLWVDPNESGWGLNLFHQNETVFGSLFVYGPDGQPRWYTASAMVSTDDGSLHDRASRVSGELHESSGPYFGGPFDPAAVQRRRVGDMVIELADDVAAISYSIDGASVRKQAVPFTFRRDDLDGTYVGYLYQPADVAAEVREEVTLSIGDGASTLAMSTTSAANGSCNYSGARTQRAGLAGAVGTYTCSNGRSGAWNMSVDVTPHGIVGQFKGNGLSTSWGRIAAARTQQQRLRDNGWRSDLWFPENEGGWGVNVIEQGDTLFATLFVYDRSGRPRWYSASALTRSRDITVEGTYVYTGALHESSGPYYGTAFNPAAVTRREVGTMSFEARGANMATLFYSVDGVFVTKTVNRFAFRKNNLTGTYHGYQVAVSVDSSPRWEAMTIDIEDSFPVTRITTDAASGRCTYVAPLAQVGEQRVFSGTYSCADGRNGSYTLANVMGTWNGFTAAFQGNGIANGHMAAVNPFQVPITFASV